MGTLKAKAVVLAAGRGERMKSDLPKVAHEILGTPVVKYVLKALREAGVEDICAVVGHGADTVKNICGDQVTYVTQSEQRGTGHAVLQCRDAFKGYAGPLLVLNGDNPLISALTIRTIADALTRLNADAVLVTAILDDPSGYGRVVRDETGKVTRIIEDADAKMEKMINEVNAGAYCFRAPEIFETLSRIEPNNAKNEYYLTDAVALLLQSGKRVEACRVSNPAEAFGVNRRRDLVMISNYLRWQVLERHMDNGVTIVDPSTTYIEPEAVIGPDTVIFPYVVIRNGVVVGRKCEIGPFTHLRSGTYLEDGVQIGNFVEVKNSRIGSNSRAKHLTYLGDAVLGRNVNIGAGTITANFDGKQKHRTVIQDGAQTGSNTVLVAPVTLGKNSKTGAGSVVTKNTTVADDDVVVGVPARSLKKKQKKEVGE